jgi:amino acid permease
MHTSLSDGPIALSPAGPSAVSDSHRDGAAADYMEEGRRPQHGLELQDTRKSLTRTATASIDENAGDPAITDDPEQQQGYSNTPPRRPWTHAWYHITVSVLGIPAAASLPYAFSYVGWAGGVLLILFATVVSYVSGIVLINLQDSPKLRSYSDVADSVMALKYPNFSRNVIRPLQFLVFVPVTIFTILILGQTMLALTKVASDNSQGSLTTTLWVFIAGIASFLFALIPSIDRMWLASAVGSLCGVVGCVMLVVGSAMVIVDNSQSSQAVDFGRPPDVSDATYAFGILSAFGNLALAFGGHSVLPVLQVSLGEPDAARAQASMKKGLIGAYFLLGAFYMAVPCAGYAAFGSTVQSNVMDSLAASPAFASVPSSTEYLMVMYVVTLVNQFVMGGVYIQAGYALVQDLFPRLAASSFRRLAMRFAFVGSCTFVALAIPFFGALAVLTGCLGLLGLTFVMPYVLWLHKPSAAAATATWKRRLTVAVVAVCVALGIGGIASGIYFIVVQASTYTFFS